MLIKPSETPFLMVSFLTAVDVLEAAMVPYKKALGLELPIEYQYNSHERIATWTKQTAAEERTHVFNIDPSFTHASLRTAPNTTLHLPSLEAILEDECKVSLIVGCLCEFHLSEKINPVLLFPPQLKRDHNHRTKRSFAVLNDYTVKMWRDDVFYSRWPDLFHSQYTAYGMYYNRNFDKAFRKGIYLNQMSEEQMIEILLGIAQLKAVAIRHRYACNPLADGYHIVKNETPQLAQQIKPAIELWATMPRVTYNPQVDLQSYKETLQALQAGYFRGTAHLTLRGGKYYWQIRRNHKR